MISSTATEPPPVKKHEPPLSLAALLDPEVLGNPYPLYHRLRTESPVHWDPLLRVWVVTRYDDVIHVLRDFSAERTPSPAQLTAMGLSALNPVAQVMVKQMLFLDPSAHTRIRGLASAAFTPPAAFGPYRVLHQIGSGVLGPVFRTYDPQQDRLVAVKVFRLDLLPEQVARLADGLRKLGRQHCGGELGHRLAAARLDPGAREVHRHRGHRGRDRRGRVQLLAQRGAVVLLHDDGRLRHVPDGLGHGRRRRPHLGLARPALIVAAIVLSFSIAAAHARATSR